MKRLAGIILVQKMKSFYINGEIVIIQELSG